jgi:RNA polymerase sigma factor (sigma-70 family)
MAGRTTTADGRADRTGDRDLVRQYLDELRAFPLLTAAEEVMLAKAIEAGRVAAIELADPDTTPPARRRRQLRADVDAAGAARARFIQSNLRLVVSVAKRYQSSGLSMLDLIQEGNLGLMRAVEKFDHRKGFKFSTYATWWIRQAITRAIADKSRTIRVPAHMGETLSVLSRLSAQLLKTLNREPKAEELAAASGIPVERVEEALRAEPDLVSLSVPVGEDGSADLEDLVADSNAEAPWEAAAAAMERTALHHALSRLSDRERDVLTLRFGLMQIQPMTLDEVGRRFDLTRERIRQIEAKALSKLRHPCVPGQLRVFASAG